MSRRPSSHAWKRGDVSRWKFAAIFPDFVSDRVRRAEPIWSLARHRVVMGVDEWDESDGGERYDLDEVADEMLGPYKEVFDRLRAQPLNPQPPLS